MVQVLARPGRPGEDRRGFGFPLAELPTMSSRMRDRTAAAVKNRPDTRFEWAGDAG